MPWNNSYKMLSIISLFVNHSKTIRASLKYKCIFELPLKYLKIYFTTSWCLFPRLENNFLTLQLHYLASCIHDIHQIPYSWGVKNISHFSLFILNGTRSLTLLEVITKRRANWLSFSNIKPFKQPLRWLPI